MELLLYPSLNDVFATGLQLPNVRIMFGMCAALKHALESKMAFKCGARAYPGPCIARDTIVGSHERIQVRHCSIHVAPPIRICNTVSHFKQE